MSTPGPDELSFLVLCGGQGRRMGQVNKPLLRWRGRTLLDHVLASMPADIPRLISANQDLARYARRGRVVTDADVAAQTNGATGPLVGLLAGLLRCDTPWLLVSPGDSPKLPMGWGLQMCAAAEDSTCPVVAFDGQRQQHLHLLVHKNLTAGLQQYLVTGGYAVHQWLAQQQPIRVLFDNPDAFANFNHRQDLLD